MTQKELITLLGVEPGKHEKIHAGKLLKILPFLHSIKKDITTAKIVHTGSLMFGACGDENKGTELKASFFEVSTKTATYKFSVPVNNPYYFEIAEFLGVEVEKQETKPVACEKKITVDSGIIDAIKKAMNFRANDELKPAMNCVCLHFDNGNVEVVSLTPYSIFISDLFKCDSGPEIFELTIDAESLIEIAAIKTKEKTIDINLVDEKNIVFAGIPAKLFEGNFPDYNNVMENYKEKMTFSKKELLSTVKYVKHAASKVTKKIDFSINGNIKLHACDIDFSTESFGEMSYTKNELPDMQIAFNHDILTRHLKAFKSDEIEMYSAGRGDKMAVFTDGNELAVIMPVLSLNQ